MPLLPPIASFPPGSVGESELEYTRPLREALTSEFARLGQQLRQDLRRELRCAVREVLLAPEGSPKGSPQDISPKFQETAHFSFGGGVSEASKEHHEWTRRHIRRFLAQEYIEELQEEEQQTGRSSMADLSPDARGQSLDDSQDPPVALEETLVPSVSLPDVQEAEAEAEVVAEGGEPMAETLRISAVAAGSPTAGSPCRRGDRQLTPVAAPAERPAATRANDRRHGISRGHGGKIIRSTTKALGLAPSTKTHILLLESKDPSTCYYKVAYLVCNVWFDRVAIFMNFASAALVGIQTNSMALYPSESESTVFKVADWVFLVFFVLEAAFRLFVYRGHFFRMSGWGWNVFDLFLVVIQFTDGILILTTKRGKDLWSTLLLRIVRVLRTIKLFRVMGYIAEFRLLVACILHSFKSFLWALALLFLLNFCMATYLVQIISSSRLSGDLSQTGWESLRQWYDTLDNAVFSIFLGLTAGVDWHEIVAPVREEISPYAAWAFIAFMLFATLALMNVVTGTFVQNVIERAEEVKQVNKVTQARKMFKSVDVDSSGFIGFRELSDHLDDPDVQRYFRTIDVDLSEARCLFDVLDMNDSGTIDFEEFLSGCVRLQGPARSLDLLMVVRDMRCAFQRMAARFDVLEMNTRIIAAAMPSLLRDSSLDETGADDLWSTMLIRIINVLRIIKLFRVMGYVPEFRLLVACIVSSLKSFLWSVALLFLLNFCMAIYLLQIIASSKNSGNLDHIGWEELSEWYGNLFIALYSIFLGLTGGVDWNDLVRPIREYVSFEAAWGLIAFMLFSILALMNVVAGTFVENAIEKAEEVKQHNKVQQARRMFKSLDVDSSGYIGFNELNDHLDDPAVQGYFRAIDVDLSEAKCLFDMLDMNDNGTIDFEEFLSGCVRLQGAARSLDLLMVVRDMRCAFQRMATRFDVLEMNTRIMASAMPSLLRSSSESEPGATV